MIIKLHHYVKVTAKGEDTGAIIYAKFQEELLPIHPYQAVAKMQLPSLYHCSNLLKSLVIYIFFWSLRSHIDCLRSECCLLMCLLMCFFFSGMCKLRAPLRERAFMKDWTGFQMNSPRLARKIFLK